MLHSEDLTRFLEAFAHVKSNGAPTVSEARESLRYDYIKKDGIFGSEIWQMARSLRIAYVAGDAPKDVAEVADTIARNVAEEYCVPLSDAKAWHSAIAWALREAPAIPLEEGPEAVYAREREVGRACRRLREKQYAVNITALGVDIPAKVRTDIYNKIDNAVKLLGGYSILCLLFDTIGKSKRVHDGVLLFGNRIPGLYERGSPELPVGWLISVGLKYMHLDLSAPNPNATWHELVDLITTTAATFDCQRYGQYEDFNLHPTSFGRVLAETLTWRELFSVQQVPFMVFNDILFALEQVMTDEDWSSIGIFKRKIAAEAQLLLASCAIGDMKTMHSWEAEAFMPTLYALATGEPAKVNPGYGGPFNGRQCNHDKLVFFRRHNKMLAVMPKSITAAALCNLLYGQIYKRLDTERAKLIAGQSLEIAIGRACVGKADDVLSRKKYWVGKERFDLDAATRQDDNIILIEAKAKSLTAKTRTGNIINFFDDFTKSFLESMLQLARHELHLRRGQTPLTRDGELVGDFRPLKVAVSFLSYGPISDKQLLRALLLSLPGSKFTAVQDSSEHRQILSEFNELAEDVLRMITPSAPLKAGQPDLLQYLHDVFWLDLGQFLYITRRAKTMRDAFWPWRSITFGSRDFWNEISKVDDWAVQAGRWYPA